MGKQKLILIFALIVLLVGSLSSIYVYATTVNSEYINVNDRDYTIDQLLFIGEERTIEIYTDIALDDLIVKIGFSNPGKHEYTIIAADAYQKTVKWENMKNGLLTKNRESIFSDLPKSFRVRYIVKIEVI